LVRLPARHLASIRRRPDAAKAAGFARWRRAWYTSASGLANFASGQAFAAPGRYLMATLEPVRRSRVYEQIVEQIQRLIQEGQLAPGDQLPPERVLAETFQVSRASVREALRALELRGLIEGRQGGGTFVRAPSTDDLIWPMASALLAGAEMDQLMEVREMIEPHIAELAALRATPEAIAAMKALLERQAARVQRGELPIEEDTAFHNALAVATGNSVLQRMLHLIVDLLEASRARWFQSPDRPAKSLAGHWQVLDAIERRDPQAAYQAMAAHVRSVRGVAGDSPS
jgi:GntR family transcriptional repressor for pyruvate dehydrogenase complex